jgi:DNA-binding CsgD family transcriptional regulator
MQKPFIPLLGYFSFTFKKDICKNSTLMPFVVTASGQMSQSSLTARERDVLDLWAKGMQQKQIAVQLRLSPETVKKHLRNVYRKLNAHNKLQALQKAGYL